MQPGDMGTFVISLVALLVSVASATFSGIRFMIDLRDRRRRLSESRPYFVLRPDHRLDKNDVQETWAAISNEGSVAALDMIVIFAGTRDDPEATIFSASANRLGPGETLETTNGVLNYATRGYPHKWNQIRIEIGYRLPYSNVKYVVTPVIGDWIVRDRRTRKVVRPRDQSGSSSI